MNVRGRELDLATLKRQRHRIRVKLYRFELFWRRHGRNTPIGNICEWILKSAPLIDDFLFIQKQIHSFLVEGSEEEENHFIVTENFERLYYELMFETHECIDGYFFRKATRC